MAGSYILATSYVTAWEITVHDDKTHTTCCCTVIRILHENGTLYTDNIRNKQPITQHRAGHHSSVLFGEFSPWKTHFSRRKKSTSMTLAASLIPGTAPFFPIAPATTAANYSDIFHREKPPFPGGKLHPWRSRLSAFCSDNVYPWNTAFSRGDTAERGADIKRTSLCMHYLTVTHDRNNQTAEQRTLTMHKWPWATHISLVVNAVYSQVRSGCVDGHRQNEEICHPTHLSSAASRQPANQSAAVLKVRPIKRCENSALAK